MVAETNTDGHIRISYFLSTVPNRNPPQWPPQNDTLLPFSISVIISHRYYWMKCTEPTLLEACSPGAFKCLSPVGSVECKGSKWPSPCSLKCISTQKQTQSLLTQSQTILSAFHILQTQLLPHTARKFLGFPAHVAEQLHDQLCHGPAALIPRCPGWTRCWQNSPTLPFQKCARLKSCSAFSRAHKNKSSQHTQWQI